MTRMKWKPVPAYEGLYEVSDDGQVRRASGDRNWKAGRVLAQHLTHDGYPRLCLHRNSKSRMFTVHVLVAAAFIGPRPDGLEVNHKNTVKTDCRLSNLEYTTPEENRRTRKVWKGERAGNAKLTWKEVFWIRDTHRAGTSAYRIAKLIGVTPQCVHQIVTNKTWKEPP